jgi:membrane protease YdiL (CAAX protease family)
MLTPGARLLAAAPRMSKRRAAALLVTFFALWLALQLLLGFPLLLAVGLLAGTAPLALSDMAAAGTAITSVTGVAFALAAVLATLLPAVALRPWGAPSFAALGLRRDGTWDREIVLGVALGPLLFALVLALTLAAGWASVRPGSLGPEGLLLGALTFTGVAVYEEVLARGVLLQLLSRAWNPAVGVLGSSVIFAVLHGANPDASPLAVVGLLAAGLLLAWGYLATGRLWLPIALHWSWNFAQGPLFGFPVSGLHSEALLAVSVVGPEWITGGGFGPEAGLIGLLAEGIGAGTILAWRRAGGSRAATTAVALAGLAGLGLLAALLVTR